MSITGTPTPKKSSQSTAPKTPKTDQSHQFQRQRVSLAQHWFIHFNEQVFNGELPEDLALTWSKRLMTTAGITKTSRACDASGVRHTASIELSIKVIDCEDRLKRTLLHEMCHAAAWMVDNNRNPPHGPVFWKWAKKAWHRFPDLEVTTCHR